MKSKLLLVSLLTLLALEGTSQTKYIHCGRLLNIHALQIITFVMIDGVVYRQD